MLIHLLEDNYVFEISIFCKLFENFWDLYFLPLSLITICGTPNVAKVLFIFLITVIKSQFFGDCSSKNLVV